MAGKDLEEFNKLIEKYANHPKVLQMKDYIHHGIRRYNHCIRVAYHTFKITKFFHLNYQSATKAAMLHDFFTDELAEEKRSLVRYRKHPEIAVENAKKYFGLSKMEEDIIRCHMFPITFKIPSFIEGWIVDIVDDAVAVYEKCYSIRKEIRSLVHLVVSIILTLLR